MGPPERLRFRDARQEDIPQIAALLNSTAGALTARFGEGHWSTLTTEREVELSLRQSQVRVGLAGRRLGTTLRLATRKPWAIDITYFTPVARPLYLTGMGVAVANQGRGWGRLALADAVAVATALGVGAIRLDAYDAPAGAGGFYASCGYSDRGRRVYRGTPLSYWEILL